MRRWIFLLLISITIYACRQHRPAVEPSLPEIRFQPFTGTDARLTAAVAGFISSRMDNHSSLTSEIPFPASSYISVQNRYSADSLIRYLSENGPASGKVIGIIATDMETRLPGKPHWGVLVLGYCPGPSSVVSTFRLKRLKMSEKVLFNRVVTVCLHEMGHSFSLPHCSGKQCLMRDAKGGLPNETIGEFCPECLRRLANNGWKYHQPPTTYSQHTENKEKNPG